MAVKHVMEEYNRICDSFMEMIDTLHEMEDLASKNIVSPEQLEGVKKIVEPMKNNKARWDYMIFLLNMPNRKEKKKKYETLNKQDIARLQAIKEAETQENNACNEALTNAVNEIDAQ